MQERYNEKFALAAVRGALLRRGDAPARAEKLLKKPLEEIDGEEREYLFSLAQTLGVKLYQFKRSDGQLPRVTKTLGFLRGIWLETLLDVGSGRGVFLVPLLEELGHVRVHSVDILDRRVELLSDLVRGGIENLSVEKADICDRPYPDGSFDVVTMLEVLEHIPDVERAIRAAVRMAREYVVVTVPSKEDDNPEHVHLLTKERLTAYFGACGVKKLHFDGVPGHLFMIANVRKQ